MNKMSPSDLFAGSDPEFTRAKALVRNARTLLLPMGWTSWRDGIPPSEHKLPVDQVLAQLVAGRRRILSPSEVRERYPKKLIKGWLSHESAMRSQLVWYAEVEFQDWITYAANEASAARPQLDHLCTSEESLDEYLSLTPTDTEIRFAVELVRKAKARVSSESHACRPPEGGRPAQAWKRWFVFRLAAFWHIITGDQPPSSPDSDFAELVAAAWNSLHPSIPEIKWDTYVRGFAKSASLKEALETSFIASLFAHRSDAELQDDKTYLLANEV
jgi:hypothetical protein